MSVADAGVDFSVAPSDYAELHRNYYEYVVHLVYRQGIDYQAKEDVASEILLRFYERDFLSKYDPARVFEYAGEARPARFKTFLSSFVLTYVQSYRDRQRRRWERELNLIDHPSFHEGGEASFLDSYVCSTEGVLARTLDVDEVNDQLYIGYIRTRLALVPRRSKKDICDLARLFDAVVAQVHFEGKYNVRELQEIFGISSTATHSWLGWLRLNIRKILDGDQ